MLLLHKTNNVYLTFNKSNKQKSEFMVHNKT